MKRLEIALALALAVGVVVIAGCGSSGTPAAPVGAVIPAAPVPTATST